MDYNLLTFIVIQMGLVSFLFGLTRKHIDPSDINTGNEWIDNKLCDMLMCDFCLYFWISLVVSITFLHPLMSIIVAGLCTLVSSR